jgi:hypothetical protein
VGAGFGVGFSVGFGVGFGVGFSVGFGVGFSVGFGVGFSVGFGVGFRAVLGDGVPIELGGTAVAGEAPSGVDCPGLTGDAPPMEGGVDDGEQAASVKAATIANVGTRRISVRLFRRGRPE